MAERITDLEAWTRRQLEAVRGLPGAAQRTAPRIAPLLLTEGRRAAPRYSGDLRRSLRAEARPLGERVVLALTSTDPAAQVQEEGGTIRSGRAMTVPVGIERALQDATGRHRGAREVPGLFAITARDGRRYLVTRSGRSLTVRFALRHEVRHRAQGWATKATKATAEKMEPTMRAGFVAHLRGRSL